VGDGWCGGGGIEGGGDDGGEIGGGGARGGGTEGGGISGGGTEGGGSCGGGVEGGGSSGGGEEGGFEGGGSVGGGCARYKLATAVNISYCPPEDSAVVKDEVLSRASTCGQLEPSWTSATVSPGPAHVPLSVKVAVSPSDEESETAAVQLLGIWRCPN